MNLQSISRLPDDIDTHPLGAPTNRAKPQPEDPGKWVPAATPGYHRHTKTGVMSRDSDVPFGERPWHKPATVKYTVDMPDGTLSTFAVTTHADGSRTMHSDSAERDDIDLMLQIVDAAGEADKRTGSTDASDAVMSRFSSEGVPGASSVPPERREECIAALKAIRADDTATCGVVPSYGDVVTAINLAREYRLVDVPTIKAMLKANFSAERISDIPADRRADVIRALNAL